MAPDTLRLNVFNQSFSWLMSCVIIRTIFKVNFLWWCRFAFDSRISSIFTLSFRFNEYFMTFKSCLCWYNWIENSLLSICFKDMSFFFAFESIISTSRCLETLIVVEDSRVMLTKFNCSLWVVMSHSFDMLSIEKSSRFLTMSLNFVSSSIEIIDISFLFVLTYRSVVLLYDMNNSRLHKNFNQEFRDLV